MHGRSAGGMYPGEHCVASDLDFVGHREADGGRSVPVACRRPPIRCRNPDVER
jgi:hypothetical protein